MGRAVELAWAGQLAGVEQRLTIGASYAQARARFIQNSQFGYLLPDHSVAVVDGPGAYADGSQSSENAFDARVDLHSRISSLGLYAADVLALSDRVRVTLAGRYDRTQLRNRDQITPGGGTGSLDADPVFQRFNPSAMVDWAVGSGLTLTAQAGRVRARHRRSNWDVRTGGAMPPAQCDGGRSAAAASGGPQLLAGRNAGAQGMEPARDGVPQRQS
jgi:outer membrane receptor protein involved in Fe transport